MSGNPSDTQDQHKESVTQRLKDKSLKAAGVAYLIGDAAIIGAGMFDPEKKGFKEKSRHALVGAYWALGGAAAAYFGNPKAEKQLELLSHRLGAYLKKQGVEVPKSPTTEDLTKHGGIIDHLEGFLYQHPSEVLNAVYALGAAQLVSSGVSGLKSAKTITETSKAKNARNVGRFDLASGLLIGTGALSGLLIPEKKPDPEHPPQGTLGKAVAWVQEKPLRLTGLLYHANNASMIGAAIYKKKTNPESKNYLWRFLTAGSYIFANTMLALSSKENISANGSEKNQKTLEGLADKSAIVIAAQPKEVQEALVQNIAGYLSAQPEIKKSAADIAELLHAKLSSVHQQAPDGAWQQRLASRPDPTLSPSL